MKERMGGMAKFAIIQTTKNGKEIKLESHSDRELAKQRFEKLRASGNYKPDQLVIRQISAQPDQ